MWRQDSHGLKIIMNYIKIYERLRAKIHGTEVNRRRNNAITRLDSGGSFKDNLFFISMTRNHVLFDQIAFWIQTRLSSNLRVKEVT